MRKNVEKNPGDSICLTCLTHACSLNNIKFVLFSFVSFGAYKIEVFEFCVHCRSTVDDMLKVKLITLCQSIIHVLLLTLTCLMNQMS